MRIGKQTAQGLCLHQIDLCFEEDNRELARTFIRKKLEAEKRLKTASRLVTDVTAQFADRDRFLNVVQVCQNSRIVFVG